MKLLKLHIYGFGKHENVQIDLQKGINIFYGENEAGKSTIQQFILHILFGFPQRNSQLLRYEPKNGAAYGGKIILLDRDGMKVEVERVRGKASGDVTLYFENGARGGERELQALLTSNSRQDIEAVNSFSMFQLQGLEKMTEEELTKTLISSGTSGIDALSTIETTFLKEMGQLFKPSGKKPLINQKVEEIRELEGEWREYLEKINEFEPSVQRLKQLEKYLSKNKQEQAELQENLQNFYRWKQLKPLKDRERQIIQQLEKVEEQQFPSEGIRRYELLKDKKTNILASLEQLEREMDLAIEQQKAMSKEELNELQAFLSYESEWHQLKARRIQLEDEQTKVIQQQMQQLALIGVSWEESLEFILNVDVSIKQEDALVSLLKRKEQIEAELLQEERLLEVKIQELEGKERQLKEAQQDSNGSGTKKPTSMVVSLVGLIFVIGFLISYILNNWSIFFLTILLGAIMYGGFRYLLQTLGGKDIKKYEELLKNEHRVIQEQVSSLDSSIRDLQSKLEKEEIRLKQFLVSYQISSDISTSLLPELFNRLRTIQEQQISLNQMEKQLEQTTEQLHQLLTKAKSLASIHLVEDMLFHQLREHYLSNKRKVEEQESLRRKQEEFRNKTKELQSYLHAYEMEINDLWQEADALSENQFYQANKIFEEKLTLQKELEQVNLRLGEGQIDWKMFGEEDEIKTKERLRLLEEQKNNLLEEKSNLDLKTAHLLSDQEQGELLQRIEEKKAELQQLVKKWASYKVVVTSIKQIMTQLKEERLPEVLEGAKSIFQRLTDYSYESLELDNEKGFEAINANGDRFKIVELSQATKEQAYLSLRLSLAISLKENADFPIIMDDPFVHFDRNRLKQVVQLIEELQNDHQILYFTCHEHMTKVWSNAHMIQVAALRV